MNLARHGPALVCDELGRVELALQALPSHPAGSGCASPEVLGRQPARLEHDARASSQKSVALCSVLVGLGYGGSRVEGDQPSPLSCWAAGIICD